MSDLLTDKDLTPVFRNERYTDEWYWREASYVAKYHNYNYKSCMTYHPTTPSRICSLRENHEGPHISGMDPSDINYSLFWR